MSRQSGARPPGEISGRVAYFPNAGTIVFGEATLDFVDGWGNLGKALAVDLFGLGAHARDSEDLSVLYDALLQLAEQDPKACKVSARHRLLCMWFSLLKPTCGVVARPEAILEARHVG